MTEEEAKVNELLNEGRKRTLTHEELMTVFRYVKAAWRKLGNLATEAVENDTVGRNMKATEEAFIHGYWGA